MASERYPRLPDLGGPRRAGSPRGEASCSSGERHAALDLDLDLLAGTRVALFRIGERAVDEVTGDRDHDDHGPDHDREGHAKGALRHRERRPYFRIFCTSSHPWRMSVAAC